MSKSGGPRESAGREQVEGLEKDAQQEEQQDWPKENAMQIETVVLQNKKFSQYSKHLSLVNLQLYAFIWWLLIYL